jgi:hypothetical protein
MLVDVPWTITNIINGKDGYASYYDGTVFSLSVPIELTPYPPLSTIPCAIRIDRGVYLGCFGWGINFHNLMSGFSAFKPEYSEDYESFGVADNLSQILEYGKKYIDHPTIMYVLSLAIITKEGQGDGGWRWHKWGDYIGKKHPCREYLADEPEIEEVLVFSFHRVCLKGATE